MYNVLLCTLFFYFHVWIHVASCQGEMFSLVLLPPDFYDFDNLERSLLTNKKQIQVACVCIYISVTIDRNLLFLLLWTAVIYCLKVSVYLRCGSVQEKG